MSTVRDLRRMLSQLAHLPPETPVQVMILGHHRQYSLASLEVAAQAGHPDELRLLVTPFDAPKSRR